MSDDNKLPGGDQYQSEQVSRSTEINKTATVSSKI